MTDKIDIDESLDFSGTSYSKSDNMNNLRIHSISTADDKITITEPSSVKQPEYPYVSKNESLSGHIDEIDDTPGNERLYRKHKSGTFEEIHPDGTKVVKIIGDDFHISLEDNNLVVGGNLNITVQGNANILTKGNVKQKVGGNYDLTIAGNMTTRVKGKRLDYTKGQHDIQTNSNLNIRNSGTFNHYSKGAYTISCSSTFNVTSKANINIESSSIVYVDGSQVHFNLPGPGVAFNSIRDIDPSGGLTIESSVIEPDVETLKVILTDNDDIINILDNSKTYPKDRTKDD